MKMADTSRSEAVTVSIEQAMSSVPPPIGPGGHPRYSQHLERERPGGPSMGYGGPPPPPGSYGNSYSSYPPPPYGSSMHGNYGGGPISGGPPPPGYSRVGYSVPPHSSGYGGPGYGPGPSAGGFNQSVHHPPYYGSGGGYESHYGSQPPPGHPSHPQGPQSGYQGPSPVPPQSGASVLRGPSNGLPNAPTSSDPHSLVTAGSALLSKKARSPPSKPESGAKNSSSRPSPETAQQHTLPDHSEVERLRAAAATEITTEEVKPIQTDFHFFVKEHIGKYRELAEEEVRSGMEDKTEKLDPMLVNSNLNTRLMKAWEGLTKESRDAYMVQEEADRRRFMEDDEIASRHCATLTARGKSPRVAAGDSSKEVAAAQSPKPKNEPQPPGDTPVLPKPVVVNKKETEEEEKKTEAPTKEEAKRPAPEPSTGVEGEIHESPSKKNKMVQ